jgi:hypothetical protein
MAFDGGALNAVASTKDAEALLDRLLVQEADVDSRLEHLLILETQPDLKFLHTLQSSLHIQQQLTQLCDQINPAAVTANGLSERVRKLDVEQGRVKECLKYVEDVQELKVSQSRDLDG